MTIGILSGIVVLLAAVNYAQFRAKRRRNASLKYIRDKLNGILDERTHERLLHVTAEKEVRELLVGVNRLLASNHEALSEGNRMRTSIRRMLSNVSHDLKTPLTVVLGYLETIRHRRQASPEETDALLAKVEAKAAEVLALIGRFFDLAKLESGDWLMEPRRLDLCELSRATVLNYYDILTNKGFEVAIDIPESPVYAFADEEAVRRILDNLLSNAVRYGYEGGIVGLAVRDGGDHAIAEVWDRGRGIRETERERIFERLYTLDDTRSSSAEGSGLGLTIAKRLAERMGGGIEVDSRPYEKTAFAVRFAKSPIDLAAGGEEVRIS